MVREIVREMVREMVSRMVEDGGTSCECLLIY